ncbi:tRNA A37 threonylcarbamoyladenosine dehydratase [Peptoniphilus ivorii]|uniref:tRNA threonylcarbamoyladenosine dehydratase n=1 Tax=Aedoeadaptatus ivorii TaxID=54006 RepID=UPI002784D9E9|nr:tRNA threonylcarbamoyladenosine dehydratase [Peptoniphilus ivorii]MDQ0508966.1 tRNA A37 threonylcarbamoyladenosine dehydratase [Peptoniphilus ivorii]
MDWTQRTRMLIGDAALQNLQQKKVIVFGTGGVGGSLAEALVRTGIGRIDIVDFAAVDVTNLNRQVIATTESVGRIKVEVFRERALSIRPDLEMETFPIRLNAENIGDFDFSAYDYVADATDDVSAKLLLAEAVQKAKVPFIASMGAGNKLRPECFEIAKLSETSVCPLARVMRREARKRGIDDYTVVYSKEPPREIPKEQRTPASIAFVPPAAGLIMASKIVRDLIEK